MVMHFKTCCCGCTLRTGTLIIGWLSLIGGFLGILGSICGIILINLAAQTAEDELKKRNGSIQFTMQNNKNTEEEITSSVAVLNGILSGVIVVSAIQFIVSVLLVYGASTDKPRFLKPWMVFAVIAIVADIIIYIAYIVLAFIAGQVGIAFLEMFIIFITTSLGVYYVLVVNSYHTELISNDKPFKM